MRYRTTINGYLLVKIEIYNANDAKIRKISIMQIFMMNEEIQSVCREVILPYSSQPKFKSDLTHKQNIQK